ncbi:hypothetical protein [Xanthocytophaga agilis]|uniref:Uncharacterized protein n=1 Tax=Xanthocytophaga agilis TaxID=3048010 RepID=A0AAE3R142_9BACT|nr:hypothetical protein [Xanthocytophaga agilis]MDJ1501821.1 hypothetical protein [Xanthocytophaga agilis]
MNKLTQKQQLFKEFCRKTLRTNPFGLEFSTNGLNLLSKRYGVTTTELTTIISQVRQEATGNAK